MNRLLLTLAAIILLLGTAAWSADIPDRWTAPPSPTELAQLPKLDQPFVPDGELAEWGSAATVPIRYESYISRPKHKGKWLGPADAGMEVSCAWSEEGLCLSAVVADDDVFNDRKGEAFWQCDCIEFHFDGRAPDKIGSVLQELGVEHVYYRPPNGKFPAEAYIRPDNKITYTVKCGGKRTEAGYTAELLVPWSAFPAFKPEIGNVLAMQWVLCDRDSRDEKDYIFPETLSYLGRQYLRVKPQDYVRWTLSPGVAREQLGMMFALDSPKALTDERPTSISVEACGNLAGRIGSVKVKAVDADGKVLLDSQVELSPLPKPWDASKSWKIEWPAGAVANGYGSVEATVLDKQGNAIGTTKRPFLAARGVVDGFMSRLEKADLPKLARTEPFKAEAYMGAASSLERLERRLGAGQLSEVVPSIQEMEARFDVLEDGKLDGQYPGLLDLLALAGDPEAGVIVEFPSPIYPTILMTWGSFPLATVGITESPSEEVAMKVFDSPDGVPSPGFERIAIGGLPASVSTRQFRERSSGPSAYDPSRRIMMVWPLDRQALVCPVEVLAGNWNAQAVVCLPGCPPEISEAAQAHAKRLLIPMTDLESALTKPTFVVAGDIAGSKFADLLKTYWIRSGYHKDGFGGLTIVKGKRVINVSAPTRKVAERVAGLVALGAPIKPSDVDAIRRDLVDDLAPRVALDSAPPKGGLYLGDVHLHTTYSDGSASPVELVLEGMYANLDYMVITDHQAIKGGIEARRLLSEYGVRYPVTVGQEISIDNAAIHANAYPLKRVIGPIPPADAVREAHAQGAIIQWNHPGWPASDWAFRHVPRGTEGTGFDAWEHYTDEIDRWKRQGIMPVVVGSTDNHSTSFGWSERTAIIGPSAEGNDLADAIRGRRAALVAQTTNGYLYGPDEMPYWVWQALADGASVKRTHAERIRTALQDADIMGLLRANPPGK